jgi:hypothetical protein
MEAVRLLTVRRLVTVRRPVTLHRQLATGRPQGTLRRRNPTTPRRRAVGRLGLHRRLGLRLHCTAKRPCKPRADRTRSCFAVVCPGKMRASSGASPRTAPNCLRPARSTFRTPTRRDRRRLQVHRRICLRVVVSLLVPHSLVTSRNSASQSFLQQTLRELPRTEGRTASGAVQCGRANNLSASATIGSMGSRQFGRRSVGASFQNEASDSVRRAGWDGETRG